MHQHPRPVAAALRLLGPAVFVLALTALLVAAAAGTAVWLLKSENGTRWLLARLPLLQAEGVHGALLSERFELDRLRVAWGGGRQSVTITGLQAEGMVWSWRPAPGVWVGLDAARLAAREIAVETAPSSGPPPQLPPTLVLPLRADVAALQIGTLRIGTLSLQQIAGRVGIGVDGRHRVDGLQLDWDRLHLQGRAQLAATPPFALDGALQLAPREGAGPPFTATLQAGGTLARIEAQATVRGQPRSEGRTQHAAPSADLRATLAPFAAWPLAALSAQTEALDLAAFASALPQTRLSGHVDVQTSAKDAPIGASVQLDNAEPGRWNERRLPLRSLALEVLAHPTQRERIDLTLFDAVLGSGPKAGGRWRGQGQWLGHRLQLETTMADVQPQHLDGRAPAMGLSGPVTVTLTGLRSPDPADTTPPPAPTLELRTTLEGRLDAAPQPVKLTLEARADEQRVEIRQLRAQAGDALAQAQAIAQRGASGAWQLASTGSLADFDPLPWWPGEAGSAWRQGPHRLSAGWQLDLRLPLAPRQLAPLALLQSLSGSGELRVTESMLAGVPLAGELTLGQSATTLGTPSSLRGELRLAGNRITVEGHGNPAGAGDNDQYRVDVEAGSLAALAPLLTLRPELAAWAPKGGSLTARVNAQGRWPRLETDGQLHVQGLQAGDLALARANATWRLAISPEESLPLQAQIDLAALRLGTQRVDQARADLRGTWRDHQLLVSAALPLVPPALAEQVFGVRTTAGTRAQLQAEGAWEAAAGGGGRWSGHVTRLAVGAWDGSTIASVDSGAGWVDARDLRAALQFGADGRLQRLQADPGRVRLAEAVALRWDEIVVEPRDGAPNIDLKAEIDPFALAPLLARWQPAMGWGGDLRLAAKLQIKAAERFDADIVFERADGDLNVTDEAGTQLLGLTDLRLAMAAHDGQWIFTQAAAGRTLGEMAGALSVRTTPQRRWPTPDAPVEGVLEARVANLGVWGTWVPPGWRLAGEIHTNASIGGRFGAPEYTGRVDGSELAVRNLLEGVNITQGEVAIQLKGTSAQIEKLRFRGGEGRLDISGGAEFGSAPVARLKLEADKFRLLGRIDRQVIASGNAELLLQSDLVKLDGRFGVDEGLFDTSRGNAPKLDADVSVRHASDPPPPEEAPTPKPRRNVTVTVDVDLGDKLHVKGRGLDTTLRGQLRITTPGGRLAINGTVRTEGGTYAAYGQKLDIDRGILAFSGAYDNPRLDILALRANTDTRVGVEIQGNVQTPRVRLYSETDMSETEKLSWLVLGRAPDGLGRTDTALLQRAAVALLAGEGDAPTDALMKNLGIDDIGVSQRETGDVRETVVTLGKQLSRRWYVGYERGVNATTGTWQLIYRIAQRFTLRAQSGAENSLDVIWVWKFEEDPVAELLPGVTKSKPKPP